LENTLLRLKYFLKKWEKDFNKAFDRRQISDYNHEFILDKSEAEEFVVSGKIL
jgi:hypothetical protein